MADLISEYGYLAVLVGCFFEGETVLVLGALAAKLEYLDIGLVIVVAVIGTFLGDNLYFFIGRRYGDRLLTRLPTWRLRARAVNKLLVRYDVWFILGFRFLYGLRSISPFVIGMGDIHFVRFMLLNFVAAVLWASAVGGASFALGSAVELFFYRLKALEGFVFAGVVTIVLLVWIAYLIRLRVRTQRYVESEAEKGGENPKIGRAAE